MSAKFPQEIFLGGGEAAPPQENFVGKVWWIYRYRYIPFLAFCSVKIAPGAVVCSECELRGDITIGKIHFVLIPTAIKATYRNYKLLNFCLSGCRRWFWHRLHKPVWVIILIFWSPIFINTGARTVIHPKAKIVAEAGPIIIGENNLIEEQVQIINRYFPEKLSISFESIV